MNRIFCLVGKSCSGKDTLYARILERYPELVPVILHTTRPRRPGEVDGKTYHFVTEEQLCQYEAQGQVIEKRVYQTTQGPWTYFTLRFALDADRLMITTLDGAAALMDCYGPDAVRLVYLHVDDRTRLLRYIDRESRQARPDYTEVCRRFVADQADFSQARLNRFPGLYSIDTGAEIDSCLARWDALYRQNREAPSPPPTHRMSRTSIQQEVTSMVTMIATVVRAWGSQVLVTDNSNGQEVLVNTNNSTANLAAGDQVRIVYNGAMTASLPPQISAGSICALRTY